MSQECAGNLQSLFYGHVSQRISGKPEKSRETQGDGSEDCVHDSGLHIHW